MSKYQVVNKADRKDAAYLGDNPTKRDEAVARLNREGKIAKVITDYGAVIQNIAPAPLQVKIYRVRQWLDDAIAYCRRVWAAIRTTWRVITNG